MISKENFEKQKQERLNEENYNNQNTLMKIVEYNGVRDIWVEFQDEYKAKVHTQYSNFKKGNVTNPYDKTVFKVGCLGEGEYKTKVNYQKTREYTTWNDMVKRCYDPYYINKHLTYKDCFVEEYLLNFQNYAQWYKENHYECNGERMHIDKDILEKGNKIYDREHMIFVPKRINELFVKSDASRGEYPIGVYYHKESNKLCASCSIIDKNEKKRNIHLGTFSLDRPFQAFYTYKVFKENYIKQVADEYKDLIPTKLYEAMYRWEVEIND